MRESRETRAAGAVTPGCACHFGNFGSFAECFGKALEGFEQRSDPTIKGPLCYCVWRIKCMEHRQETG